LHSAARDGLSPAPLLNAPVGIPAVRTTTDWLSAGPLLRLTGPASWFPLLTGLWLTWVAVSLVRLVRAIRGLALARRACVPFPADRESRLRHWMGLRDRGRRARLASCARVRWAGVLGLGAPVIAVAPDVLRALNEQELDQVIAHEWVHVQRRDDLTALLQALVRTAAGFHPAVWWIGRRLDVERELACDELAVRVTGSVRDYARCLTKLASLPQSGSALRLAPAARSSSRLTARIVRLVASKGYPSRTQSVLAFSTTAAVLLWLAPITAHVALVTTSAPQSESVEPGTEGLSTGEAFAATHPRSPGSREIRHTGRAPLPRSKSRAGTSRATGQIRAAASTASLALASPGSSLESVTAVDAPAVSIEAGPPAEGVPEHGPTVETPEVSTITALPGETRVAEWPFSLGRQPRTAVATSWGAVANSGVAIGRGSQNAAVATAGFFNRLGKRIAGSF
jgi:beta-lactamase regulating signal transducer with metallopeptidase domain